MLGTKIQKTNRGDTIVEVLIAIAVASFAIGTAYAISNRSLQTAITARERNDSVYLVQNQIAALKVRYNYGATDFNSDNLDRGFVVNSTFTPNFSPDARAKTNYNFCLDPIPGSPDVPGHPWGRIINTIPIVGNVTDENAANNFNGGYYAAECIKKVNDVDYYVNISAQVTISSKDNTPSYARTVYKVAVKWPQTGGGIGQTLVYYRM